MISTCRCKIRNHFASEPNLQQKDILQLLWPFVIAMRSIRLFTRGYEKPARQLMDFSKVSNFSRNERRSWKPINSAGKNEYGRKRCCEGGGGKRETLEKILGSCWVPFHRHQTGLFPAIENSGAESQGCGPAHADTMQPLVPQKLLDTGKVSQLPWSQIKFWPQLRPTRFFSVRPSNI